MEDSFFEKHLEQKLQELRAKAHFPPKLVAMACAISLVQANAVVQAEALLSETLGKHMSEGAFLARADFPVPLEFVQEQVATLLEALLEPADAADANSAITKSAQELQQMLKKGEFPLDQAVRAILDCKQDVFVADATLAGSTQEHPFFAQWKEHFSEAPQIVWFVVNCAVTPFAVAVGKQLAQVREAELAAIEGSALGRLWTQGGCPLCGSRPFISFFEGKEGHRLSCCSFCRQSSRVPRLQCAYCLEETPEATSIYSIDAEPGFIVQTCDSCKRYLKIADFRNFDRPFLAALDELLSLSYDIKAQNMGYLRSATSIWGI